jgi:phage terminase large subunit-like protein
LDSATQTYRRIRQALSDPETLDALDDRDKQALVEWIQAMRFNWHINARENQKWPPGSWSTFLFLAGRGSGKTRAGAEAVREAVTKHGYTAIGLIAPTAADARDTMIDGKGGSSLLEVSPKKEGLVYYPTKRKLTWGNGAVGNAYSAEEPERLRGPQSDFLWMDELASWRYLQETMDMAAFGHRLGKLPRRVITTTPKPNPILVDMVRSAIPYEEYVKSPGDFPNATVITRGSTMDNADNLAPQFLDELRRKYEGTRLGRQEIYAEILDDNPNALFRQDHIDFNRVDWESGLIRRNHEVEFRYRMSQGADRPQKFKTVFSEVIVAVDPSVGSDKGGNETGIIVMAVDRNRHLFVLEDASGMLTPNEWGKRVIRLVDKYDADGVVAEVNQGGDLVESVIRAAEKDLGHSRVAYKKVRASRGKYIRAEPVGALEEQGRIHHVDDFPKLEEQLVLFQPSYSVSPDRLDAYVWAAYHLVVQREKKPFIIF